ncbi:glycosyltransferase family 2 protein [Riemerella anatipestifer]|uniref:glycosyltransferase family 2 protein n=1 Tax=Riemerella anatipestifer TaxID=34085 RepID=UPI001E7D03EB|nr:glycosyltransferase family 2 protein [Riemerella anatipestifer]QZO96642.1 glycosyltransferase family 2 protein [Riemerella anatipestifer]
MKIDVIIPTYNGSEHIAQQIESILQQPYENITIHLRDDGSKDDTVNIIKSFSNKYPNVILYQDLNNNLGLVKNVEYLLTKCSGDLIFLADQDDVWYEDKIKTFLSYYKPTDTPTLLHSNCMVTDGDLNERGLFLDDNPASNKRIENSYFHYFVQGASSMINKSLKNKILPFPNNIYIHDRYIHFMAELFGERVYIPQPTIWYRQHGANLIGSNTFIDKLKRLNLKQKFYLEPDKKLIEILVNLYPDKKSRFKLYFDMVNNEKSRWSKWKLMYSNNIPLRMKEKVLLWLNN